MTCDELAHATRIGIGTGATRGTSQAPTSNSENG